MSDDKSRPTLLLFMGENEDHAVTSIEFFYPASVHLITSDKFAEKYEKLLTEWSTNYDFRRGLVCSVEDLFEATAMNSLLSATFSAIQDEFDTVGDLFYDRALHVGITGGTMHMATAGTYISQLIDASVFYVMRPPEGQPVVPRRDVVTFPALRSLKCALKTRTRDIHYLASKNEGKISDLLKDTWITEGYLEYMSGIGLLNIGSEDDWALTDLGKSSFGVVLNSTVWSEYSHLLDEYLKLKDEGSDDDDPSFV